MPDVIISRKVSADDVLDDICSCVSTENEREEVRRRKISKFVGQWVYFPHRIMHVERNRELLERFFKGEARGSLCREYKISRSQFHRIVKEFHQGGRK